MSATSGTTLKVSPATRDRVKAVGADRHLTADQVINAALDQLDRDQRRRQMREESRIGMIDPRDQDAIAELRIELDDVRAW
jgi:hypothetical protein